MKQILTVFTSLILFTTSFSQHVCGTLPPTVEQYEYTRDVIANISVLNNAGTTCIPIRPHVIRADDGSGGISLQQMNSGLAQLNEYYIDAGIEFYWCGVTPDYIDDDDLVTYTSGEEGTMVAAGNEATDALNMYFMENPTGLNGYAYFPFNNIQSTRIVMRNGATGTGNANTMIHELGHTFSLYHTHQDTEFGSGDPDAEHVPRLPDVNANCDIAGDLICDTEADPRYSGAEFNFGTCTYTGLSTDAFGNLYTPNIDNAMNYFPDACQTPSVITPEQFLRVQQGLVARQGHTAYSLDCAPTAVPVATGLTATLGITGAPSLTWTDNASGATNDMGYLIERSTTNLPTSWRTYGGFATGIDGTSFVDNSTLVIGTTYYYRVKATNGDCNSYSNVNSVVYLGGYCPANGNSCDESVDTVRVGTIDNGTNDCGSGNGYNNHTDISTDMVIGTPYPIEVISRNDFGGDRVGVWVDWNQDFSFDDANESILMTDPGASPYTGTITPPVGAALGSTVMRVRIHFNEEATTDSCGATVWGEVEDYAINVIDGSNNCSITAIQAVSVGACQPATNTYSVDLSVLYSNPPATGNLVVNGQSFPITNSPQDVTLTGLAADGNNVDLTGQFTDSLACTFTNSSAYTAPLSCLPCSMDALSAGTQTACDGSNNFTQEVTVTYTNPPATGQLSVNGQTFAITASPQMVTLTGLASNGSDVDVTASFTDDGTCTLTSNALFTAPVQCVSCTDSQWICGATYSGETTGESNDFSGYNCIGWDESGPEYIHEITTYSTGDITATISSLSVDLDIFILSDCLDANSCLAFGNTSATIAGAAAGTYFVIVDGYQGVDGIYNLDIIANCTPPTCAISDLTSGTQSVCVPATNTYSQQVIVTYANAPGSGTLDVNGQSFAITSSPQTVILTGLTADGNAVNVTAAFSADGTCNRTEIGLFTSPSDCTPPPPCGISDLTAGTQTACVPATNTYTQEVVVTYANAPGSGTLDVNGQSFGIASSPQTVTLTGLTADGNSVDVTASFSADAGCNRTEIGLFTAPADCTPPPPCGISNVSVGTSSACDPGTSTYTQEVTVTYANAPATGTLRIYEQNFVIGTSPQTETVIFLNANGNLIDMYAYFSAEPGCNDTLYNAYTAPTPCSPVCSISDLTTGTQTACVPGTNTYTQEVVVTYTNEPSGGALIVNGLSVAITGSPQTVTLTGLTADGGLVDVTAAFTSSANGACSRTETDLFMAPADCTPVPCMISDLSTGTQTACVPGTNTYTQEVVVTYSNEPSGGALIVNGQSFAITGSPQTVTLTGLTADGGLVDVTAAFTSSANGACSRTETALFMAPADCTPVPCMISDLSTGTQTACVPGTNTYTQEVVVTYTNEPSGGALIVNGLSVAITGSPQTVTLTGLTADGGLVDVTAAFTSSANGACSRTETALFMAPADCTPVPCMISDLSTGTQTACVPGTNTYTQEVVVTYTNEPSGGALIVNGLSVAITGSPQTVTLTGLTADGGLVDVTAAFTSSANGACSRTETDLFMAPADCTPIPCAITDLAVGNQSTCLPGVPVYTQQIIVTYNDAPASGTLDVNGQSFGITGSPQTCTLVALTANGADVDVTASFSANGVCNRTETDLFSAPSGCATLTWTGNTSTDWHDMTNWSPNEIPTQFNPVVIPTAPTGGNFPVIATASPFTGNANNIDIETGATLDVQTGKILFVRGDIATVDPIDLGDGIISMTGTGLNFVLTGEITCGNLELFNCFVSFNSSGTNSLSVRESIELIFGTLNANNGTVTLLSSASGTAYLDEFTFSGTYIGDISVQRYVTPGSGLGQRYFGAATATPINGLDATYTVYPLGQLIPDGCGTGLLTAASPYSNLMQWNEVGPYPTLCQTEGWEAIDDANALTSGRGYSGWMNDASIISTSGVPNAGAVNYTGLTNSANGVIDADGWHLLSNPYPSPIAMSSVANAGFTSPQYHDASSGSFAGSFQPIMPGSNIPIMQGFMAETVGPNDWSVTDSDRSPTYMSEWYANESWFDAKLDVLVEGNGFADITYVYFNEDNTAAFDSYGDCKKRESNVGQPTLYTLNNGIEMSLNGMANQDLGISIPMGLSSGTDGSFTLRFDGLNTFPANTTIYIEDLSTGSYHNITNGDYTFVANELDQEDRFVIHFVPAIDFVVTPESCDGALGSVSILNPDARNFELTAQNSIIESGQLTSNALDLSSGLYALEVFDQYGGSQSYDVQIDALETITADFILSETVVQVGTAIALQNTTIGSNSSTWTIDGNQLNDILNVDYTFTEVGQYVVSLEVNNNECADLKEATVTVLEKSVTGVENNLDFENIRVYTNSNEVVIDLSKTNFKGESEVAIYNLLGQIVTSKVLFDNEFTTLEIVNAEDGYYFVSVKNGSAVETFKVQLIR